MSADKCIRYMSFLTSAIFRNIGGSCVGSRSSEWRAAPECYLGDPKSEGDGTGLAPSVWPPFASFQRMISMSAI